MKDQKAKAVRHFWGLAVESIESAEREFKAGANNFAINRAYYSIFYAVSGALLERDRSFVKHSGVRAAFHKEFVKTGLIDKKWSRVYDRLFDDRQQGDYIAFVSFDAEVVEKQISLCNEFLQALRPLIKSLEK